MLLVNDLITEAPKSKSGPFSTGHPHCLAIGTSQATLCASPAKVWVDHTRSPVVKSRAMMASLNSDAGDCVFCPVPKKTRLLVRSIPGVFQTADPAGAYFFVLVNLTLPTYSAGFSTL